LRLRRCLANRFAIGDSDSLKAIFTLKGAFGVQIAHAICRTCDPAFRGLPRKNFLSLLHYRLQICVSRNSVELYAGIALVLSSS
jgi:hypothetical protein